MEKSLNNLKIKICMEIKRNLKLFAFLTILLLLSSISFSQNVIIEIPKYLNIVAGEKVKIPIKIFNYENYELRIFINVFPSYYEGISVYLQENELILKPKSSSQTFIIVNVPLYSREKTITYKLFVDIYDAIKGKVTDVYEFSVNIIPKSEIIVENFGIDKHILNPNEIFNVFVTFKNLKNFATNVKINVQILFEERTLIFDKYFTLNILPYSSSNFSFSHNFSYFDKPGKYSILITSFDESEKLLSKLSFDIKLEEIRNLTSERKVKSSFLKYSIIIYLKNNGNVKEEFTITERIPLILKPFVVFENFQPEIKDEIARWKITLDPQEEIKISYSILYFIPISAISLIAFLIFLYYFFFVLVPKYKKEVELKEDIYGIKIVVKNNTKKRMKNIEIKDFVPSLFSIVKFETLKPEIKKTKEGYELTWKIKELKPKDEIILFYKVKPLIEIVGEVKFPEPKIKYVLR